LQPHRWAADSESVTLFFAAVPMSKSMMSSLPSHTSSVRHGEVEHPPQQVGQPVHDQRWSGSTSPITCSISQDKVSHQELNQAHVGWSNPRRPCHCPCLWLKGASGPSKGQGDPPRTTAPFAKVGTQLCRFKFTPGLTAACPNHKCKREKGSGLQIWWRFLSPEYRRSPA